MVLKQEQGSVIKVSNGQKVWYTGRQSVEHVNKSNMNQARTRSGKLMRIINKERQTLGKHTWNA